MSLEEELMERQRKHEQRLTEAVRTPPPQKKRKREERPFFGCAIFNVAYYY
jgi:hypothetical protein